MTNPRTSIWIWIVAGVVIRLLLVFTSIGTNDIPFHILWAKFIREEGIARAYTRMWELNHPPLALLLFTALDRIAQSIGIEYTNLLRVFQVGADVMSTLCLAALPRSPGSRVPAPADLATLFILCPVAIFISGFHGNTDPTMIALLLGGLVLFARSYFLSAGVLFALSVGIKIVPLLLFPLILIAAGRAWWRILTGFVLATSAIFLPPLLIVGDVLIKNVFGYSGFAGKWGFAALALWVEGLVAVPRTTWLYLLAVFYAEYGRYLVILAVLGITIVYAIRFRSGGIDPLLRAIPITLLLVLFLAPGFGVQYLLWPIPLLPLALGRRSYAVVVASTSLYLFITYTVWSGGFPWWYADSIAPSPGKPLLIPLGLIVWLIVGAAAVISLRSLFRVQRSAEC